MPTITNVEVANLALSHIGAKVNLDTFPTSSSTGVINQSVFLWYHRTRLKTLEFYNWSFARKLSAILADHAIAPDDGIWGFRYVLPADLVKVRSVANPAGTSNSITGSVNAVPFELSIASDGTKSIQTNLDDTKIIYTFDQTDITLYSDAFIEAWSHVLAANLAFPITRKRSLKGDHLGLWRQLSMMAAAEDANESVAAPERDAEWIRGR